LQREIGDEAERVPVKLWDSMEGIQGLTDPESGAAYYPPCDSFPELERALYSFTPNCQNKNE
jgi:hypothetical protein